MTRALVLVSLLSSGCILEDNPQFAGDTSDTDGGTNSGFTAEGSGRATETTTTPTSTSPMTGATDETDGTTTGGGTGGNGVGCDDPDDCRTLHLGPLENMCPHMADGVMTDVCDYTGAFALRLAVADIDYFDEPGLIIMHDNAGTPAEYWGSVDVPRDVTIRAADGVTPSDVVVMHAGRPGAFRLVEDNVHLHGFTIACDTGCQWAFSTRADPETEGTETAGHLVENLVMAAMAPEVLGSNSIEAAFESLGPNTTVRNCHIWGYFEGTIDLRFAENSTVSHNTFIWYQSLGDAALDASNVDGLEISNNVFASLTRATGDVVLADDGTKDLLIAGNIAEGFSSIVTGVGSGDPDVTRHRNTVEDLAAESPRAPVFLQGADAEASDMGVSGGASLDGVVLAALDSRLPGAYQERSQLSVPRRTVIRVGEAGCGGEGCDVDTGFENELQYAAWSAWPRATIELYPSGSPFSGPMEISWPVDVIGMGSDPADVVVQREIEDDFLLRIGVWRTDGIIRVLEDVGQPVVIENLTVEAGEGQIAFYHEGVGAAMHGDVHEIRRVIVRGVDLAPGDITGPAFYLGDDVSVHDVLVHGGVRSCVRFGPRSSGLSATPTVRAFVHHITCRLTVAPAEGIISAFDVASVDGAIIADAVVELATPGPIFHAQRRGTDDSDPDNALDKPLSFHAEAIAIRNFDVTFDGFADPDGIYDVFAVDEVMDVDPLFVSATDSHLDPLCIGVDSGVDPEPLEPRLRLGTSVDGIDRNGLAVDRGAYEQGS